MTARPSPDVPPRHVDSAVLVGERLRRARQEAGFSLRRLAFAGCSAAYISAIEHGRRVPSLQVLRVLAERLDVNLEWLCHGSEERLGSAILEAELALRLGDPEAAEHLLVALAESGPSDDVRARALAGLGELCFQQGEVAEAIERLEAALALADRSPLQLPAAAEFLGRSYALRGDLESAIALFDRVRAEAVAVGDRVLAVRFVVLLANAYVDIGDVGGSALTIAEALEDANELADPLLRARVEWTQSRLHTVEGRHDLAARFAERALATYRVVEDAHAVARAQQMLAYIEIERGNPERALQILDSAASTMSRLAGPLEQAVFDLERARALTALGRYDEAKQRALEIAPRLLENARGNSGRCLTTLAEIFDASGDDEAALGMLDAAIDALAGHRSPHLARAYRTKAAILERLGRADEALQALKSALDLHIPSRA